MGKLKKQSYGACVVCKDKAEGKYFGAIVCLPCKSFFIRCTKEGPKRLSCHGNKNCDMTGGNRMRCSYCRHQKCLAAGMARKEKPERIEPDEGQELCRVCSDIANGVHFGVTTCEGCKKFFRRAMKEYRTYRCKFNGTCTINPRNRNTCRSCRYNKCLQLGMSRTAIRMGRPRKLREIMQPGNDLESNSSRRTLASGSSQGYSSLSSGSGANNCMYTAPWLDSYGTDATSGTYLCLPDTYSYYGYCVDKTSFLLKSLEDVVNRLNVDPSGEDGSGGPFDACHETMFMDRRQSFMLPGGAGYMGGMTSDSTSFDPSFMSRSAKRNRDFMPYGQGLDDSGPTYGGTELDYPRSRPHPQGLGDSLYSLQHPATAPTLPTLPDTYSALSVSTPAMYSPPGGTTNSTGTHRPADPLCPDFPNSTLHKPSQMDFCNNNNNTNNNSSTDSTTTDVKFSYPYPSRSLPHTALDYAAAGYMDKKPSQPTYAWGASHNNPYFFLQHGLH